MIYGCLLFALVLLCLLLSQKRRRLFRAWIRQGEDSIRLETASRPCQTASKIPDLLQQYLQQVLPASESKVTSISLRQQGTMILKEGGPAQMFQATQILSTLKPQFSWTARLNLFGFLPVTVCDRLIHNQGHLRVRIAGLWTVADASGPAVSKGEVLRYMAELPWAPWGFLQLEHAHWEELVPNELALSLNVGNQQARLIYRFNAQGLIESIRANDRPRDLGQGRSEPTPWEGTFKDYKRHAGVLIPTYGEIAWLLPTRRFQYFQASVLDYEITTQGANCGPGNQLP